MFRELTNATLILLGILCAGLGLKGFLLPSGFIDGGVTGVSLLLATVTSPPLAFWLPVINVPFVAIGYRQLGAAFAIRSALAIGALAAVLAFLHYPTVTQDRLLDAVFGEAERAMERATAALGQMRELGEVWGQSNALVQLVDITRFTDLERCHRLLTEGIELAGDSGLDGTLAMFHTRRAQILTDMGELEKAEQDLKQVAGSSVEETHLVSLRLAQIMWLRAAGRLDQARRLMDETEPAVAALGGFAPAYIEPAWRIQSAYLAWEEGDPDRAWKDAGRAWWLSRHGLGSVSSDVLDALAVLNAEEDPERAALMLGYAARLRGVADTTTPVVRRVRGQLRERLGEEAFTRFLGEGEGTQGEVARSRVAEWLAPIVPDDVDLGDWAPDPGALDPDL